MRQIGAPAWRWSHCVPAKNGGGGGVQPSSMGSGVGCGRGGALVVQHAPMHGRIQGVRPPIGQQYKLFNIGPKVGPSPGPPFFNL